MAKQLVGIGTTANDGTGDPLRTAFDKVNDNFNEVYAKPDLTLAANILTLTKPDGTTDTVDLSPYLDEDARAIASGTINGSGIVTFTRDDATTFTLDLSSLLDDTVANDAQINIGAGDGLTGGGNFTTNQSVVETISLNVVAGTGITVTADAVSTNDGEIVHDNLSGFVANEHIDHSSVSITAGNGLTGGGDLTATRDLAVNVDDSTIEISSDTVRVKDDGITYAKMGTEFTTAATISASDVDFSSAAVFTKTLAANTTLTFSNVETGMVKDLVITGDFTLTLPASVKTITGTYDGTVSNLIQIVSTNGSTEQWATISQAL